ncbi:DUF4157 domain-containing protein [Verrucomicrobiota bacterium]
MKASDWWFTSMVGVARAVLVAVVLAGEAYAGLLDDVVSHAKTVGKGLEQSYQAATKPVRDASHTAYEKTIRQPFNEVKGAVDSAVSDRLKYTYKDNIEGRFRPATDGVWDATTGRKPFSEAAAQAVDGYVEQAKEFLVPPELYVIYQSAKAISDPLPKDSLDIIAPHWDALTERTLHREARYAVSSEVVDLLSAGNAAAITIYDVVAFREPLSDTPSGLALLAHEMVHVDQYHELGFLRFAAKYYVGGKLRTGRRNPLEDEAYGLDERMLERLRRDAPPPSTHRPARAAALRTPDAISVLAAASAMGGGAEAVIPLAMSEALSRANNRDIVDLTAYSMAAPGVPPGTRAEVCRLIASGRAHLAYSAQQARDFAKLAVHFEPGATINWYFLAMSANRVGDTKTEYEALVQLAAMMIAEELETRDGPHLTPRLRGAEMHLNRAAALGEQLGWSEGFVYDNRLPFIMLVSIGLELTPTWLDDNAMIGYADRGLAVTSALHKHDRWHFALLDVTTQAGLRAGVNMGNPMYLQQCINHCLQAANEYARLGTDIPGVPTDFAARMRSRASEAQRVLTGR